MPLGGPIAPHHPYLQSDIGKVDTDLARRGTKDSDMGLMWTAEILVALVTTRA